MLVGKLAEAPGGGELDGLVVVDVVGAAVVVVAAAVVVVVLPPAERAVPATLANVAVITTPMATVARRGRLNGPLRISNVPSLRRTLVRRSRSGNSTLGPLN